MINMLEKIQAHLSDAKRLLIVLHDNPDPDAIASGWALKIFAESMWDVRAVIACGGFIGRAENRSLVRVLKIPLKSITRLRITSYDRIVMLDTQPGNRNHSLPAELTCHVVIDHHSRRSRLKTDLALIDTDVGATATLVIELLQAAGIDPTADLSTALAYAIRSETQDLGREANKRDIQAYFWVYPKASMRKLASITHPKLSRAFFTILAETLNRALICRNMICAHLGEIPYPDAAAEMADFLLQHQRIGWTLCTGRFKDGLLVSIRASNPKARAGKVIQSIVPDPFSAGGHDTFAGGRIATDGLEADAIRLLEEDLAHKFAQQLGHKSPDWKGLL